MNKRLKQQVLDNIVDVKTREQTLLAAAVDALALLEEVVANASAPEALAVWANAELGVIQRTVEGLTYGLERVQDESERRGKRLHGLPLENYHNGRVSLPSAVR